MLKRFDARSKRLERRQLLQAFGAVGGGTLLGGGLAQPARAAGFTDSRGGPGNPQIADEIRAKSPTGMPYPAVNLATGAVSGKSSILATIGSNILSSASCRN